MTPVSSGHGIPSRTLTANEKKIFLFKDVELRYNNAKVLSANATITFKLKHGNIVFIQTVLDDSPE